MTVDTGVSFAFPALAGRKVTAAFDGGRLSSDGGVMLLAAAARRMGIAGKLAAANPDRLENTPDLRNLSRLGRVMVDLYCASYPAPPEAIGLGIDDTVDIVHGHQ